MTRLTSNTVRSRSWASRAGVLGACVAPPVLVADASADPGSVTGEPPRTAADAAFATAVGAVVLIVDGVHYPMAQRTFRPV
jgi:hypothetical protein